MTRDSERIPGGPEFSRRGFIKGLLGTAVVFAAGESLAGCSTEKPTATATAQETPAAPIAETTTSERGFTDAEKALIEKLDKMDPDQFEKQPLEARALWTLALMKELSVTGYPLSFGEPLVPGHVGSNPKNAINGSPWEYPTGRDADGERIMLEAEAYNAGILGGIGEDMHDPGEQPYDRRKALKLLTVFYLDPDQRLTKTIKAGIEKQTETTAVDVEGVSGLVIVGTKQGSYKDRDGTELPSTSISYESGNLKFTVQYAFIDMSKQLGKTEFGKPAGMWVNTGEMRSQ